MNLRSPSANATWLSEGGFVVEDAAKAGIAAIACSTLFLTAVLTAMLLLPVGVG
jgi:hypothetical protein